MGATTPSHYMDFTSVSLTVFSTAGIRAKRVTRLKTFLKSWKQEITMKSGYVIFRFLSNLRILSAKNIIDWQIGCKLCLNSSTTIGDIEKSEAQDG